MLGLGHSGPRRLSDPRGPWGYRLLGIEGEQRFGAEGGGQTFGSKGEVRHLGPREFRHLGRRWSDIGGLAGDGQIFGHQGESYMWTWGERHLGQGREVRHLGPKRANIWDKGGSPGFWDLDYSLPTVSSVPWVSRSDLPFHTVVFPAFIIGVSALAQGLAIGQSSRCPIGQFSSQGQTVKIKLPRTLPLPELSWPRWAR